MFGVIPALSRNPESLQEVNNAAQVSSWIPACAGMTTTSQPITSIAIHYWRLSSNLILKFPSVPLRRSREGGNLAGCSQDYFCFRRDEPI